MVKNESLFPESHEKVQKERESILHEQWTCSRFKKRKSKFNTLESKRVTFMYNKAQKERENTWAKKLEIKSLKNNVLIRYP